jgi:Uma2 family endonuclease
MAQAQARPLTFAEFLDYGDADGGRYDLLADGSLVEVPSEAEINSALVMILLQKLAAFLEFRLAKIGVLELEVQPIGDGRRNRRPDLAILTSEHLNLDSIQKRTALFWGSLPPRFVAEVVSPGDTNSENYQRDYIWKRQQYQDWQIPEYWIIDPHRAQVTVLILVEGIYQASTYSGHESFRSVEFPQLDVTAQELLNA